MLDEAQLDTVSAAHPSALSTRHIVYLVVSAAAPLSAMAGTVPLAFGNGADIPPRSC
ncbi:hypothetical protein AB0E25_35355 [Streptomyces bobili]|uniref:hypothetical protein n=1 Tax=Streptomyces bobili TaxID=67280 RepID=UPI0033D86161